MRAPELFSQISAGKFLPVYLFAGDEQYLLDEAFHALEQRVAPDSLNRESFACPEASAESIISASQTMPFMSDRRLVVVKDAHKLKAAECLLLAAYINRPSQTTILLLLWAEKLRLEHKKNPLCQAVDASGGLIEFKTLYDNELPGWVQQKAARQGKKIAAEAAELLVRESGSNLLDLANEIEKLLLYTAEKKTVTVEDVESCSGHTRQTNLNQMFTAVEEKNAAEAVRLSDALIREGEFPLRILATIQRAVRRLLMAKGLLEEEKQKPGDITRALRLHQYFDRGFFQHLGRFTRQELQCGMRNVLRVDQELKASSRPDALILEELLLGLCGYRRNELR